jgi:glycosyltransferase involved in cell wall biosynthesis
MRDLVRTEGLDGVVALPGHRSDVARFHAAIDLHLFLSFSEGLPRAVLESMAAGVPVVATAVTGVVDVVTDGETGLLVPPGDAAAAAAATARLLRDPPLRARLAGAAGRRVRGTYSAVAMTRAYEALYADLANGRSPGVTSPSDRARDPR